MPSIPDRYLIWSNEHRAWWKPHSNGYTTLTHLAGQFTEMEARKIIREANVIGNLIVINEVMVLAPPHFTCEADFEIECNRIEYNAP